MPRIRPALAWLATLLALSLPLRAEEDVTIFAAASLKTALDAALDTYAERSDRTVTAAYAGSSVLARQIAHGAGANLFISANADWMDDLAARGRIVPGTRRDLFGNALVLIGAGASPGALRFDEALDLPAALDGGRLAMALVDAVPAGIYGRAALETLGLWEAVEEHVAQTDNVRAALALVALRAAPLGIVYATDAAAEPRVSIRARIPADLHPPILYPAALVTGHDTAAARDLLRWLGGAEATAIFADHGFRVPARPPAPVPDG